MPAFPKIQVTEERDVLGIYSESGGNAEEARRCIPQKGQALGLTKAHFCSFLSPLDKKVDMQSGGPP